MSHAGHQVTASAIIDARAAELVLPEPETLDQLGQDQLVAAVTKLGALQARATARLAVSRLEPSQATPAVDRWLDAKEIAEVLSVTKQYAYDLVNSGDLPAIEFGPKRYKRVRVSDLERWCAEKRLAPPRYATYHSARARGRGTPATSAARTHTGGVRPTRGRHAKQRGSLGARGDGGARNNGAPDASPCRPTLESSEEV